MIGVFRTLLLLWWGVILIYGIPGTPSNGYTLDWFQSGGAATMLGIVLLDTVGIPPLTLTSALIGRFKQWLAVCGPRRLRVLASQRDMDKVFTPEPFNITLHQTNFITTMIVVYMFSTAIPILIPLAAVNTLVRWILVKWDVVCNAAVPPPMNEKQAMSMEAGMYFMLPYLVVLSNLYFWLPGSNAIIPVWIGFGCFLFWVCVTAFWNFIIHIMQFDFVGWCLLAPFMHMAHLPVYWLLATPFPKKFAGLRSRELWIMHMFCGLDQWAVDEEGTRAAWEDDSYETMFGSDNLWTRGEYLDMTPANVISEEPRVPGLVGRLLHNTFGHYVRWLFD
mmetsp:Transcript_32328/g.74027  ORF Transcript_32328/g.74027 Transcript_32328/m.74027 type:complete len:334 (-) Transcript_32328:95-1096(-)